VIFKILIIPFVLKKKYKFLGRNQPDLRRSKLKSCAGIRSNRPMGNNFYSDHTPQFNIEVANYYFNKIFNNNNAVIPRVPISFYFIKIYLN